MNLGVSAIVPTLNGARTLPVLLAALERRRGLELAEIVAIDSGSRDGTRELLAEAGAKVLDLGGARFGHGSARNRAAEASCGEALLFITQDVEPVGDRWLAALLEPLADAQVAGVFGRQVPRDASPEETFLAKVNYAGRPRRLTAADAGAFGPGTILFSSAFGIVRRSVWERLPFPEMVMSEDQAWAMAALKAGHEIAYEPRAEAYHGHRFSFGRAFRRNFDSGSSLQTLALARGAWRSGPRHLARELRWVASQHGVTAALHALVYEAVRMGGFQAGRAEKVLPRGLVRLLGEAPR
ncbi:MAG: glycosyltransferase family 2 protein [Gemmatimonadales bacterium]|jgi:rhamnosyltransferase